MVLPENKDCIFITFIKLLDKIKLGAGTINVIIPSVEVNHKIYFSRCLKSFGNKYCNAAVTVMFFGRICITIIIVSISSIRMWKRCRGELWNKQLTKVIVSFCRGCELDIPAKTKVNKINELKFNLSS